MTACTQTPARGGTLKQKASSGEIALCERPRCHGTAGRLRDIRALAQERGTQSEGERERESERERGGERERGKERISHSVLRHSCPKDV